MAYLKYYGVGIKGLSAAVPKNVYNNLKDNQYFDQEDREAIVGKTGISERRVAPISMCASDLCMAAADKLLNEMCIDRDTIDALISITQTPDYRTPGNGSILQDKLHLSQDCATFDINLGCSGFVYGLSIASSLLQQKHIRHVLLLNGETRSKAYSFRDRKTGFLFADAGSACLLSKESCGTESHYMMESFGSLYQNIIINAGGYRNPSSFESVVEKKQEDGSFRSEEQGFMDGGAVFEFAITEVPKQVKQILKLSEIDKETIDFFVLHQANAFMNNHLVKKMKIPDVKAPMCLDRYGNTSSVSIPLTIVSELHDRLSGTNKLLLSGFGVGLSVGSAILHTNDLYISELEEI